MTINIFIIIVFVLIIIMNLFSINKLKHMIQDFMEYQKNSEEEINRLREVLKHIQRHHGSPEQCRELAHYGLYPEEEP